MNALSPEVEHARSAGLRYVDDRTPGIRRERTRTGFAYVDQRGQRITNDSELARIKSLAIPPAYEDVWICPLPHGHVQATARDARGRKQYRYHKRWREVRDENKYRETVAFARALTLIRERVNADTARNDMSRDNVLATVVRLLDATVIRVGNESYARENDSYGLTTLRSRHVRVEGDKRIRLRFRGKSGVDHAVTIEDRRLARTIKRCRDLPGELLFSYLDDERVAQPVESDDVNAYLRETTGADFSAKDFRTWAATVTCAVALEALGPADTQAQAKSNVVAALTQTAKKLGNTPSVCRKAYVHPAIIETYLDNRTIVLPTARAGVKTKGLDPDELRVLAFLDAHATRDDGAKRLALLKKSVGRVKAKAAATAS